MKLTKKALIEYLEANPNKKHRCGDESKCVLANYFVANPPAALAGKGFTVGVDGETAVFYPTEYDDDGDITINLPGWMETLVNEFDEMDGVRHGGPRRNVTSKKILEKLNIRQMRPQRNPWAS